MIKTSEELGRDCDDAERVLYVLYDIFKEMCEFRTTPQITPERFIQVYKQQIGHVFEAIATSKMVYTAGSDCHAHFNQFMAWINQADVFNTISDETPLDARGDVSISAVFNYKKKGGEDVNKILSFIAKGKKIAEDSEEVEEKTNEESESDKTED
jgi:hypothetical protein